MSLQKEAAKAHLDQACSNFRLYQQLREEGEHRDWALTLLFYCALQLVQTYFVETASTAYDIPHGHDQRREAVVGRLPGIWQNYRYLDRASQVARYQQDRFEDPTDEELQFHLQRHFEPIIAEIESRLGFDLNLG